MTFSKFQSFVLENAVWFRGRLPEPAESLQAAEAALGVPLSGMMKWLLREWGYWHATGVPSLREVVSSTLQARESLGLPERYVILQEFDDSGVVLFDGDDRNDEGEPALLWMAPEDLFNLCESGRTVYGVDRFSTFGEWAAATLEREREAVAPQDVEYQGEGDDVHTP